MDLPKAKHKWWGPAAAVFHDAVEDAAVSRCGDRLGAMAIAVQTSWRPELAVQTSNLRIITWRVEWPIEFL